MTTTTDLDIPNGELRLEAVLRMPEAAARPSPLSATRTRSVAAIWITTSS